MDRPSDETVAWYEQAVPDDPRARRGSMFGLPCAFVNGNMFFGTFAQSVVIRVGSQRATELADSGLRVFEPMPGRAWKEYVQVKSGEMPSSQLAVLAAEALEWVGRLPPKGKLVRGKAVEAAPRVAPRKPAAKKAAPRKPAARKAAPRKPAAKKAAKKAPPRKPATKKAAKKAAPRKPRR